MMVLHGHSGIVALGNITVYIVYHFANSLSQNERVARSFLVNSDLDRVIPEKAATLSETQDFMFISVSVASDHFRNLLSFAFNLIFTSQSMTSSTTRGFRTSQDL